MKKLGTTDIFAAMRIVKASGMREELKPVIAKAAEGKFSFNEIGVDAILSAMEALSGHAAEKAIYDLLARPFEMTPDEVAEMPLEELADKLQQIADENDLPRFFKSLSGLMKSKSLT